MQKKRVGIIGCGEWGPNHIRTFNFHPQTEVTHVCDTNAKRTSAIQDLYPHVKTSETYTELTRSTELDVIVITTPVSTHYEIAKDALNHNKDVFCEKTLTQNSKQSEELSQLAKKNNQILMVGYVFLYNPGILKLKQLLKDNELGEVYYAHAKRTNLGPVRRDINALFDLASHDVSIFNFLFESTPEVHSASGSCYLQKNIQDVVFAGLQYAEQKMAHLHASWLDPRKVREITVVGSEKMVIWNDLSLSGCIKIFSKKIEKRPFFRDYGEFQLFAREDSVLIPNVPAKEPLRNQADHFIDCLNHRSQPITNGQFAVDVERVLENINAKIHSP